MVIVAFLMTLPDDGVNVGAAMLALLAVPLSVGASVTLIVSMPEAGRTEEHPPARRIAATLAAASIALLCGSMVFGPLDDIVPVVVAMVLLTTGIATFVASSALFAAPRSRQD